MKSRYDYMRSSVVEDTDGQQFPDPLTINYQTVIDNEGSMPETHKLNFTDLKKLWLMYYKQTESTEMDDVLYSVNGIEHVGLLEPGDVIYMYDTNNIKQYDFKNLS